MQHWPKVIAFALFFTVSAPGWAQQPDQEQELKKALSYLEGLELPPPGAVDLIDCRGKWRTDPLCVTLWAAQIKFNKKEWAESVRFGAQALRKRRNSRRALMRIGRSLVKLGSCEHALDFLERGGHLTQAPATLDDYLHCLSHLESWDSPRPLRLAHIRARWADDEWNWWKLASLHAKRAEHAEARIYADRIVESAPDSPFAWQQHALIMWEIDATPDGLISLERAIELREEDREFEEWEPSLEDLMILRVSLLMQVGRFEEAAQAVEPVLESQDVDMRRKALGLRYETLIHLRGYESALRFAERHADALGEQRDRLVATAQFKIAAHRDELDRFPTKLLGRLSFRDRIRYHLLQGEPEAAARFLSERIREEGVTRRIDSFLEELDFRKTDCSLLGKASYKRVGGRYDGADVWKQSLFKATWSRWCKRKKSGKLTAAIWRDPHANELAQKLHEAAVHWETGDYRKAFAITKALSEDAPPVAHSFAMWAAAAEGDLAVLGRHARLARRSHTYSPFDELAFVLAHLKRGDAATARQIYKQLSHWTRQTPVVATYKLTLLSRVLYEAKEHDADFAMEMALNFLKSDGPLERAIFRELRDTGTRLTLLEDQP